MFLYGLCGNTACDCNRVIARWDQIVKGGSLAAVRAQTPPLQGQTALEQFDFPQANPSTGAHSNSSFDLVTGISPPSDVALMVESQDFESVIEEVEHADPPAVIHP